MTRRRTVEEQGRSVRGHVGEQLVPLSLKNDLLRSAARRTGVEIVIAVAFGDIKELLAVGRPSGIEFVRTLGREPRCTSPCHIEHPDVEILTSRRIPDRRCDTTTVRRELDRLVVRDLAERSLFTALSVDPGEPVLMLPQAIHEDVLAR